MLIKGTRLTAIKTKSHHLLPDKHYYSTISSADFSQCCTNTHAHDIMEAPSVGNFNAHGWTTHRSPEVGTAIHSFTQDSWGTGVGSVNIK